MIDYVISIKYMLAGYAVILVVLASYLIFLIKKWRNLKQEYEIYHKIIQK